MSDGVSGLFNGHTPPQVLVAARGRIDWKHGGGGVYIAGVVSGTLEAVTVTVNPTVTVSYTVGGVVA